MSEPALAATAPVDAHADTIDSASNPSASRVGDLPPGRMLRHFRVDALLGHGGMGAVYRAFDTSLERPVALKVLLFDGDAARARFLREARAQAQIRHPNVVPIHFVGEADEVAFLVMDLVEGTPLSGLLAEGGPLSPERALDVADAVAQALDAAHERGLVHRDVKPSNILVDHRGHVLLADFGLAKLAIAPDASDPSPAPAAGADGALTYAGAVVGTPAYLAPEQADGASVDHRADVYSLGVTLFEALTGRLPFHAETSTALLDQHRRAPPPSPRALAPAIAPGLEALVLRMLAKQPEARFGTYRALRDAIARARRKPLVRATVAARASATLIDLPVLGLVAALASSLLAGLQWPAMALVMGLAEGRFGTTPGKRLLKLATVGREGEPIGMTRGLVRAFAKLWGPIVMHLVQLSVPRGTAASVVLGVVGALWALGWLAVLAGKKVALHDRLARSEVVYWLDGGDGR